MTAGTRDSIITLQRFTTATDEYGDPVQTWADAGKVWARVFWGRGDERRTAAMEQGQQPATFQMLANILTRGLTVRDRILFDGAAWDIQGIAPTTRAEIEITAVRGDTVATAAPPAAGGQLDFSDPVFSGLIALILEDA